MTDIYDEAMVYLAEHPGEIEDAWMNPDDHGPGCLFQFVPGTEGCLTMIRTCPSEHEGSEWHDEIVADDRIPKDSEDIKIQDLPAFAEWQRKIHGS